MAYRILHVAGWDHDACAPIDGCQVGHPLADLDDALDELTLLLARHYTPPPPHSHAGALVVVGPDGELCATSSGRMARQEERSLRAHQYETYRPVEGSRAGTYREAR